MNNDGIPTLDSNMNLRTFSLRLPLVLIELQRHAARLGLNALVEDLERVIVNTKHTMKAAQGTARK